MRRAQPVFRKEDVSNLEVRWRLTAARWVWREGPYHLDKSIFSRTWEQNPSDVGGERTRCEQPVEGL